MKYYNFQNEIIIFLSLILSKKNYIKQFTYLMRSLQPTVNQKK